MKLNNFLKVAVVAALTLGATGAAKAIVAYDFPTTLVGDQAYGPWLFGNEFVVNSAINVTAVGVLVPSGSAIGTAVVPVALYQLSGGQWNQIAGTLQTFSSGNPGTLVGNTLFQTLASAVTLGSGTYAIVSANQNNTAGSLNNWNANANELFHDGGTGVPTFNTGGGLISMRSPEQSFFTSGTTLSGTLSVGGLTPWTGQPGIPTFAGPTFDYNSFAPVPESSTFAVAGVGMLGLVYFGRGVVRRAKAK